MNKSQDSLLQSEYEKKIYIVFITRTHALLYTYIERHMHW